MKLHALVLAAALITGCAATPTGVDEIRSLQVAEAKAEQGEYAWSYFYPRGIASINALQPAPWLELLRQHYSEMKPYADALDAGKITRDEFNLIREKSLREYRPRLAAAQKTTPYLIGETRSEASDGSGWAALGIIAGALLGASLARPLPPQQPTANCTSWQNGRYINTTCY